MVPRHMVMNVFDLRNRLVDEYRDYVTSFLEIRDGRIRQRVQSNLAAGKLWPEPRLALNPSFAPGESIDALVSEGLLHQRAADIFRVGKSAEDHRGQPMHLYRHQTDAVRAATGGRNVVLTTGTGSGKSMAYIVPIVDHVLRHGSGGSVKAIVVYPMNALANSQERELAKFLEHGVDGRPPVRVRTYTGQQSPDERRALLDDPPDVILTNYVMLELILTRVSDRRLVEAAQGLQFLVLDELHTYRGRQGADVALLVRRLREACDAPGLQCIGTSATLATEGTYEDQQDGVSEMASQLFGTTVEPSDVIGETLTRTTRTQDDSDPGVIAGLRRRVERARLPEHAPTSYEEFVADPLSSWIETTFGVTSGNGRLTRATPRRLRDDGALRLHQLTNLDLDLCVDAIQAQLMAGCAVTNPATGAPVFAFRLHQFISKGDTVYASLEPEPTRYLTLEKRRFVSGYRDKVVLPLAFCRACGQEYYTVAREAGTDDEPTRFLPRALGDQPDEADHIAGFLFLCTVPVEDWTDDPKEILDRVPEDWLETANGQMRVKGHQRPNLPRSLKVTPAGTIDDDAGLRVWWVPAPFRQCLRCNVAHSPRRSDISKLSTLGTEGRSTATTILSQTTVRELKSSGGVQPEARKLLAFTDNRQDASLQAGHFNDFVQTVLLRSALYRALDSASSDGLEHDQVNQAVFRALNLPFEAYAADSSVEFAARADTERTFRQVLGHFVYGDLERGWRLNLPNLEQCGLLEVSYTSLDEACQSPGLWGAAHPALAGASAGEREAVATALLDYLRRELAVKVDFLDQEYLELLRQRSSQRLAGPWALEEGATRYAGMVIPRSRQPRDFGGASYLSSRSGFGRYLRRPRTFAGYDASLTLDDLEQIIADLFAALQKAALVEPVHETRDGTPAYQLPAASMVWRLGDGTHAYHDPIRVPRSPEDGLRTNSYFVRLYRDPDSGLLDAEAREHTAQVEYADREERERRFRSAELPVLYCSPTMELGVDIADLNVVGMRNVPPTPANYAQRSGRAGRSGQPALVFTYCSVGSPHDQWFFRRPELMVSGQVRTPRLDLTNEDLLRSHVHAIWLSESRLDLGNSLVNVLEVDGGTTDPAFREHVIEALRDTAARERAREAAGRVLRHLEPQLRATEWWRPEWLDETLADVAHAFAGAAERWRGLYRSAVRQQEAQNRVVLDRSASQEDRKRADQLRREAERQLDLLCATGDERGQSDFYSYRYFAGEGFLPGYSFPRLPLSAYIPGRTRPRDGSFVSRPRFLAISEFGPRSLVYHEGRRYQIQRVILPASERTDAAGDPVLTIQAKVCDQCGYLHDHDALAADRCLRCHASLPAPTSGLFRLQNVSTRIRERINADEEERQREGFEIHTGFRFAERAGRLSARTAEAKADDGTVLATLTYGETATLWRVNVGRTRRANSAGRGFPLDIDRGDWLTEADAKGPNDDGNGRRSVRVVPYVEDSRNCLLLQPAESLDLVEMASLQAALKNAVQIEYNLEDGELAAEPLPNNRNRRLLLLYESAEGGAGVLRRLVEDSDALARVARRALDLCHFDPETGTDMVHRRSQDACEAACYDCLLSYRNQPDHRHLDRDEVRPVLLQLAASRVSVTLGDESPEVAAMFTEGTSTEPETRWLEEVRERGLRLPDRVQAFIEECDARPDFVYDDSYAVVYVDGPGSDDRQNRDNNRVTNLRNFGYTIIRFGHPDDWAQTFTTFDWVFGRNARGNT